MKDNTNWKPAIVKKYVEYMRKNIYVIHWRVKCKLCGLWPRFVAAYHANRRNWQNDSELISFMNRNIDIFVCFV